jgi:hypothetical protein
MSLAPPSQPQAVMSNNAAGRRSYVVKEVERLKENREKRRARQLEIKEEKTALMNMDPGNPNWELAAMIRYEFLCHVISSRLTNSFPQFAEIISQQSIFDP